MLKTKPQTVKIEEAPLIRILCCAAALMLLAACGGESKPTPTPTKTPTASVATNTPNPPTDTPVVVAATATPAPPTNTPVLAAPTDTPAPLLPTATSSAPTIEAVVAPDASRGEPVLEIGGTVRIVEVNKRAEYVDLQNQGDTAVDLAGWRLLSEKGAQDCALGGVLQPGEMLRVWSQSGDGGFSCQFDAQIWNNSEEDPAVLFDPSGAEVSRW
jgi:hypothetical protein